MTSVTASQASCRCDSHRCFRFGESTQQVCDLPRWTNIRTHASCTRRVFEAPTQFPAVSVATEIAFSESFQRRLAAIDWCVARIYFLYRLRSCLVASRRLFAWSADVSNVPALMHTLLASWLALFSIDDDRGFSFHENSVRSVCWFNWTMLSVELRLLSFLTDLTTHYSVWGHEVFVHLRCRIQSVRRVQLSHCSS